MKNFRMYELKWADESGEKLLLGTTSSLLHDYSIANCESDGKFKVIKSRKAGNRFESVTGFNSIDEAKNWVDGHYHDKMEPFVKPDALIQARKWFEVAKPEPTLDDLMTQIGVHVEEFTELLYALGLKYSEVYRNMKKLSDDFKNKNKGLKSKLKNLNYDDRIEIADAIADGNVTGSGVLYMLKGIDILGVQNEVNESNDSKYVDGKAIFDDNGKIAKPDSFKKPDLKLFVEDIKND